MVSEGMIYMYYGNELIRGRKYLHPGEREKIMNDWRRSYAATFNKCAIHIVPVVDISLIGIDGKNLRNNTSRGNRGNNQVRLHTCQSVA